MVETYISAEWLKPLEESLRKSKKQGVSQGTEISSFLRDPESFLRHYVEPRCRYHDHTGNEGQAPCLAFDAINLFLGNGVDPSKLGGRQMLVLGDSGTGKTSLMAMLKLAHSMEYRPVEYRCEFIRLDKDSLERIESIQKPMETVVLLDGLDEDPTAKENARQRLLDLLQATRGFLRVFITCQNRYFMQNIQDLQSGDQGRRIGDFDCPMMMLLDFDDDQVAAYLEKRFTRNWKDKIVKRAERDQARARADSLGKLKYRPQILSLIEDLMLSEDSIPDEYSAIEASTIQWLIREEEAHKEAGNTNVSIESLYEIVKRIALSMVKQKLEALPESIAQESISSLQSNLNLSTLAFLPNALIHGFRDPAGQPCYRFIHSAFREFLAVQGIFDSSDGDQIVVPDFATNRMIDFIVKGRSKDEDLQNKKLIMRDLKLSTFGFESADLHGAVIEGADLRNANFQDADLREVNFTKCCLEGARFDQAITTGAIPDTPTVGLPVSFGIEEDVFLDMLWVEPGNFTIGHRKSPIVVEIKEGYWLAQFPTTQRLYKTIMESNPSFFKSDELDLPVEQVTWYDAQRFCQELNSLIPEDLDDDYQFRLPGEIEWVYACRAGSNTTFSYGDGEEELGKYGWYSANSGSKTHKVGMRKPNPWGFYDMHGNVWEWCKDRNDDFFASILTDMTGSDSKQVRAVRGGCWSNNPWACRTANRNWYSPEANSSSIGFRVALFRQPKSKKKEDSKEEPKRMGL